MVALAGGPVTSVTAQNPCNSLHTNKLRRLARKGYALNLTQNRPPESTMELLMGAIDFTNKALGESFQLSALSSQLSAKSICTQNFGATVIFQHVVPRK